jgi:hypothetical protein
MSYPRLTEDQARAAIEDFLADTAPGYPTYGVVEDGDNAWAFWVSDQDTTSYLHADGRVEWYGTAWPDFRAYDPETGNWTEVDTPDPASDSALPSARPPRPPR